MYSFGYFPGVRLCFADFILHTLHPALEDGTDRWFRNVDKPQSDAGEIPKRIHTWFKTRRKFEIKKTLHVSESSSVHHQELFTVYTAIHTGFLTANCQQTTPISDLDNSLNIQTIPVLIHRLTDKFFRPLHLTPQPPSPTNSELYSSWPD